MNRDLRIDSIRGILLAVMTIDHFGGWLALLTAETLGFVSALEGFIFLSGFVFAQVYLKLADNPKRLWSKSLSRAWMIYRYHLVLLLIITLLLYVSPLHTDYLKNWIKPYLDDPLYYFGKSLILLHQSVYMDILPIYWVFVLVSPAILLGFRNGSSRLVLVLSVLVWVLAHFVNPVKFLSTTLCNECRYGFLNLFSWQIIWVSGLFLGYTRFSGQTLKFASKPQVLRLSLVIAVVLFLIRHQIIPIETGMATDRETLGWLRLLDFYVVVLLISTVVTKLPRHANLPWLSFIGRYSLQVFTFHVLLSYLILPYSPWIIENTGPFTYTLFTLLVLASLSIPALLYQRYQHFKLAKLQAEVGKGVRP